jgi:DNA topoisomerase-3
VAFNRVFIAEKPSLAEAIAKNLGSLNGIAPEKKDGYWDVGEDAIAYYFGHMFQSAKPQEYGDKWQNYSIDNLPYLVPMNEWKRNVSEDSKKRQVKIVEQLAKNAKIIVNCGDAGREGQLLVDEGLQEMGINPFGPNIFRLWVQAMTEKDMKAGLNNLLLNSDKKKVFDAAFTRQIADWQHGMTLSTLYNILAKQSGYNDVRISVGRVQTPTLKLVVDRDRERANFKPVDHYIPQIIFKHENGLFKASWVIPSDAEGLDSEGRLVDKNVALKIIEKIRGKQGTIVQYKSEAKFIAPPLGFSLSALQSKCGSKFGLTAQETLDVAQALYEKYRVTTYPRSDCPHLPTSLLPEIPGIIEQLSRVPDLSCAKDTNLELRSAIWNDSKVEASDHHAILPNSEFEPSKLERMSDIERSVFLLISQNLIAQFYGPYKYKALSAEVKCEQERFKATGQQLVDMGWKSVYTDDDDIENNNKDDDKQSLPEMNKDDNVEADKGELASRRTSPPPAFNDGSLIDAMKNAYKFETDPELKKKLKEDAGIGTEATRAATIELLLKKQFLKRKGKNGLESTPQGQSIIDSLPSELSSVGLTALWEGGLSQIEKGNLTAEDFLKKQGVYLQNKINDLQGTTVEIRGARGIRPMKGDGDICPVCEKGHLKTRQANQGNNKGRRFLACTQLLETSKGEEPPCKFFYWETKPIDGDGKECPECKKGKMLTFEYISSQDKKKKYALRCSRSPLCKHVEFQGKPKVIVPDLPGTGDICPECGKGHLKTVGYKDKQTGEAKSFLACDIRECNYTKFPDSPKKPKVEVPDLPGTGDICPKCGKGHLKTVGYKDKKTDEAKSFLACDIRECKYTKFPDDPKKPKVEVPDLPGTGDICPECGKGHLKTVGYKDKKTDEAKSFLACDIRECNYTKFPDSSKKKD